MENRVISASAGTGKTHRLAIEYIAIILKNLHSPDNPDMPVIKHQKDFLFERILVVTFTRKAAAEIRNKIFSLLDKILIDREHNIIEQLEKSIGFVINEEILSKLEKISVKIKTHKDKIRISTIDSLINQVFKTMIAPIMKLTHYTIDEKANFEIWEQIFDDLVNEENISVLKALNHKNPQKNIENLGEIFKILIEERWIYSFIKENELKQSEKLEKGHSVSIEDFQKIFMEYCHWLNNVVLQKLSEDKKNRIFSDFFNKVVSDVYGIEKKLVNEENFIKLSDKFIESEMFNLNKQRVKNICDNDSIKLFSGTLIKIKPEISINEVKQAFLRFVYYEYVLKEYSQILDLWDVVLTKYDKIKQKTGILSYSDISWYTYHYLYNPEYSMIDKDRMIVENLFYEFLAVRNQYLLIDEFQDTSLMQFMILAPMINELSSGESIYNDTAVIVVGDEKQSIYGWRGGVRELLRYMQKFLRVEDETLKTCYRSVPVIVDFINDLFSNLSIQNWFYPEGIISANKEENGAVNNMFYEISEDSKEKEYFDFVELLVKPAWSNSSLNISKIEDTSEKINQSKIGETAILARTNEELEMIASILTANNIPFIKESSRSIFDHKLAKAILNLLRYIQYLDYNALLRFLRSDVVLLDSQELKNIAVSISKMANKETLLTEGRTDSPPCSPTFMGGAGGGLENISLIECKNSIHLSKINDIYKKYHSSKEINKLYKNPLILSKLIVDAFQFTDIFNNEIDIKNLNSFMSIISDFLNDSEGFTADLEGFLRYSELGSQKSNKKQLSSQEKNAIQLLTIHKSKGLGFDTVFLFYDSQSKRPSFSDFEIDYTVDFQGFNSLSNVFLGLNYKQVLKDLFYEEYAKIQENKDMEEINNAYVALTRAKTNLVVFWLYKEKELLDGKNIKSMICSKAKEATEKKAHVYKNVDLIKISGITDNSEKHSTQNLKDYFDIENKCLKLVINSKIKETKEILIDINQSNYQQTILPLKTIFLTQKSKLYGSAAHIYLSFLKYDLPEEHRIAFMQTKRLYGNILTTSEINELVLKIKTFIHQNQDLFSKKWDKIFNEFSIYNDEKKLSRIDRLMINSEEKKILIVDYKTGQISNEGQIEYYKKLIKQLLIVEDEKYKIETKFVVL
ncbi:MAG: UvrD-helicase domain-containing protein [Candidatus Cloacimonetes bacterium]|nr:UvrD-helicase domain-containing protein [Candidatus Cloacimonadota bacterium]